MSLIPNAIQATSHIINGYPERYAFASLSPVQSEGEGVLLRRGEELRFLQSYDHLSSIGLVRTSDVARSTAAAPRRASCVAISGSAR